MTAMVTIGIDLAKNVFAVHGVDATGKTALVRPSVLRARLLELIYGNEAAHWRGLGCSAPIVSDGAFGRKTGKPDKLLDLVDLGWHVQPLVQAFGDTLRSFCSLRVFAGWSKSHQNQSGEHKRPSQQSVAKSPFAKPQATDEHHKNH